LPWKMTRNWSPLPQASTGLLIVDRLQLGIKGFGSVGGKKIFREDLHIIKY
jgi:hypothetical protein